MKNFDNIKNFTDDEMAEFLTKTIEERGDNIRNIFSCHRCDEQHCTKCIKEWLNREC